MNEQPQGQTSLLPEEPGFGLDPPPSPTAAAASAYRVLARKYRPGNFDDLIGQDVLVRTLTNAFALGRVHQAYILTGTRGIGKTTTARILARAFNYLLPGKIEKPSVVMPEIGVHCQAIMESRHIDVIEMDAASHTGIDDVREIIENARYLPVSARTKIYIIDEVHMLSKAAFNGLLKTLEEPPPHVKFIFATTEIEKVPITVRSRCLRFDLKRVEPELLAAHLARICGKEKIRAAPDALAMIARAAEGSVRDGLSLLDQAIASGVAGADGATEINAEDVRAMLGLADRARVIDLFEALLGGDIARALELARAQYDLGADPAQILADLAEFTHFVTRVKIAASAAETAGASPEERARGLAFAEKLGLRALTRVWQLLIRGLADLKDAPKPAAAADMTLVRIAHAADVPTLDEALKFLTSEAAARLPQGAAGAAAPAGSGAGSLATSAAPRMLPTGGGATALARPLPVALPQAQVTAAQPMVVAPPAAVLRLATFADVVAQAEAARDIQLKVALESDVRLVRFEQGAIEFSLAEGASPQLAATLMRRLQEWTGARWMVAISTKPGAPTLKEQAQRETQEKLTGVRADPLVRSVLDMFPGAEITAVRMIGGTEPAAPVSSASDEVAYAADDENDEDQ